MESAPLQRQGMTSSIDYPYALSKYLHSQGLPKGSAAYVTHSKLCRIRPPCIGSFLTEDRAGNPQRPGSN